MDFLEVIQAINDSELGTAIRESVYAYPVIEGVHLVGLAFSIGLLLFVDLRLVGLFLKHTPIISVLRPLRPWLLGGFLITFLSGILLFISDAAKIIHIWLFPLKLLLIVLAGLNAAWFEYKWGRNIKHLDTLPSTPTSVRLAGITSLTIWILVVVAGRMIPYFAYK